MQRDEPRTKAGRRLITRLTTRDTQDLRPWGAVISEIEDEAIALDHDCLDGIREWHDEHAAICPLSTVPIYPPREDRFSGHDGMPPHRHDGPRDITWLVAGGTADESHWPRTMHEHGYVTKRCIGCGQLIDPEVCGCGDTIDHPWDGHMAFPLGCDCLRETEGGR